MKLDKVRELSLTILVKIEEDKAYSNIVLEEALQKNKGKLEPRDVGLISEIVYGVTTWKLTIDTILQKYANIKLKKMSCWVRNLLRMGAYQILFLDKIPKSAAVNESVNLSKKYAKKSSGFINAILRKIVKEDLEKLKQTQDETEKISKITSMPLWIVEKLKEEYSSKQTEQICEGSNIRPNISIRINTLKTNKKELQTLLEERKIEYKDSILPDFLELNHIKNITNLDLYQEGLFTLQDVSAGIPALVLDPKQGEKVLDCCSAPGGKTTYLAERMHNEGTIIAWDVYEKRLELVKQNCTRLGINIVGTEPNDATVENKTYREQFDNVLLDVPCLGLGVIRRKPDIKWQRKPSDVQEIQQLQYDILNTCSKYVKKGGKLVYSTCSILKEENEEMINRFMQTQDEFQVIPIQDEQLQPYTTKEGYIKLFPDQQKDGFFICLLQRKR